MPSHSSLWKQWSKKLKTIWEARRGREKTKNKTFFLWPTVKIIRLACLCSCWSSNKSMKMSRNIYTIRMPQMIIICRRQCHHHRWKSLQARAIENSSLEMLLLFQTVPYTSRFHWNIKSVLYKTLWSLNRF